MSSAVKKEAQFTMPFGTRIVPDDGVLFRLWAPGAQKVDLRLTPDEASPADFPMTARPGGWFVLHHKGARAGDRYQYRIDGGLLVPDPVSRRQDRDIHGASVICDPNDFAWHDLQWPGRPWQETVIYELHVGTFSPRGSFAGVSEHLDYLVELGVTAIELMPLAEFPGRRNWGYDGALLFAPCSCYGSPDDLKNLIQSAHDKKLMVFLDVVYNHFGPEGNYLYTYAKEAFFTEQFHTPWGAAIRFSGPQSRTVRDFYIANALYWLKEYHFDGLRFDAVHSIFDRSDPDILEEIGLAVQTGPATERYIHLILENDNNITRYLERRGSSPPPLYAAQWNDDFHHACHVLLTGETKGYYGDYADDPADHLGRCLTEGFSYQGQESDYRQGKTRGEPSGHLPLTRFVSFLQNHDQIGNRAFGERLITLADQKDLKIMTTVLLLAPSPPLLFMGEEMGTASPFYFFCDFEPALAESVTRGRRKEFAGFADFNSPASTVLIPDPNAELTFMSSKLDWDQGKQEKHQRFFRFYRSLLEIRRNEIIPRLSIDEKGSSGYRILAPKALTAWWQLADGSRLTMIFSLQDTAVDISGLPAQSRCLYQIPPDDQQALQPGFLPPKSVFWYLTPRKGE
ncbi:MAG: malto-oligosyltrehalose trehalohydrolase [Desulforhopalus sp.]